MQLLFILSVTVQGDFETTISLTKTYQYFVHQSNGSSDAIRNIKTDLNSGIRFT